MKHQAPTGVYVLPAADSLRRWYGVIFIRKGHYRGGIFKFVLIIPPTYPDDGPKVHFLSEVFHPLIHPETGLLDISIQFPQWSSNQHYIVLLLCYIKKIFYKTEYWEPRVGKEALNPKAQSTWMKNKEEYFKQCEKCTAKSQLNEKLYSTPEDPKMSIRFERPRPAHEEAYRRIINQEKERGMAGTDYLDWFTDGVYKLDNGIGPVPIHLPAFQPVTHKPTSHADHSSSSSTSNLIGPFSPISPLIQAQQAEADRAIAASSSTATTDPNDAEYQDDELPTDDNITVTLEERHDELDLDESQG